MTYICRGSEPKFNLQDCLMILYKLKSLMTLATDGRPSSYRYISITEE